LAGTFTALKNLLNVERRNVDTWFSY